MRFIPALSLFSNLVFSKDDEDSPKTSKKRKGGKIDTTDIEGEWDVVFYYNNTQSKLITRACSKKEGITWKPVMRERLKRSIYHNHTVQKHTEGNLI